MQRCRLIMLGRGVVLALIVVSKVSNMLWLWHLGRMQMSRSYYY